MENEKIILELDKRIKLLFQFKDKEKREYLKLVVFWILYHPKLQDIYSVLDRNSYTASQDIRDLENKLYQQILIERKKIIPIYNKLRKEILLSLIPDYSEDGAKHYVDNYDNDVIFSKKPVHRSYHWHRQIVEKIWFIKKDLVSAYIDNNGCLSSEAYKIFVKLSNCETKYEKIREKEDFGSLGYLRQILREYGKDTLVDYESYLNVMGVDFIIFHLIKIRDYIYAYFFDKKINDNNTKIIDTSKNIWAITPKIHESKLIIGKHEIQFFFDRNPNGTKDNVSFELIKIIIKAGQSGINKSEISKQNSKIDSKDISGYLNSINTRMEGNTGEYNCKIISSGPRGSKKIFMTITTVNKN